jgi:putative ABC transport system permease protein
MQTWLVDRTIRDRLLLLFAAVGLVLLLACTNVASLLLARSATRSREIALRVSLGATRGRLIGQLLTESCLLGLLGGTLGLLLAALLINAAPSFIPANALPTSAPIELNAYVAAFTLGISLFTGLLFGLAPALAVSSPDVQEVLQDSSRGSTGGPQRQFFRQVMVTFEVAVALILLASATLMLQSMRKLARADLGIDVNNTLTLRIFLPATGYNAERSLRFTSQVLDRVKSVPGVEVAGLGSNLPLNRYSMEVPFDLESSPPVPQGDMPGSGYITVSPGYFGALGVPLAKDGRDFSITDAAGSPAVLIVNQAFARRYFGDQNPIGKRLRINRPILGSNGFSPTEYEQIVSVAGNVTLEEIGAPPQPLIYAPLTQNVWSTVTYLTVRTRGEVGRITEAARGFIMEQDPNQPLEAASSMTALFDSQFAEPRFQFGLMSAFAFLALALAVVGIYGVNSYAVTQRQREIGVRMALGASPGHVLIPLVAEGMKFTGIGIFIGIIGAMAMGTVLNSVLVGVTLTNPIPLMFAALLLAVVAAVACYIPARRATRMDPAITLRQE